ncbi:MAG: OmpA family protein [Prevotella sp.]|nr:OmpA family protein [Prevotella sp.]
MKKLLIVLAFASVSVASMAQETTDPTLKYSVATNSFWANWYIQANFNWSAFYSSEEHNLNLSKSPFKGFRTSPSFSVAIGKWFTPGIGLRTKFYGIAGREVWSESRSKNRYDYWNIEEQIVLNLSNLFFGYNPTRVWNLSFFGGTGVDHNMSAHMTAMSYSLGLISQWRVSKHWQINLEGGWLYKEHDADADGYIADYEQKIYWENHDHQLYLEAGLTYNLGKCTWDKVPDVDAIKALSQAQIDALNAQLADALAENARLKELLANQKPEAEPVVVKEYAGNPVSVFFNINKTVIANESDLVDVKTIAEYAKDNELNLLVTGYADSATGDDEINQSLSEGRAEAVADELVKMGVSPDNIETAAKGGVDDLSPVSYNRRATVEVK